MNLLERFSVVQIRNEERISLDDKIFCETYQEAYTEALKSALEIHKVCNSALAMQSEIFYALPGSVNGHFLDDLTDLPELDKSYEKMHHILINQIVHHFNSKYNISISSNEIAEHLLPEEPSGGKWTDNEDDWKAYRQSLYKLVLNHSDILDQLFILLNGRSFVDRALDELKDKCHNAAWNTYSKKSEYEVKKDVLRLTSYACKYDGGYCCNYWELNDCSKTILRGIAHFETDTYDHFPHGFSDLLSWRHIDNPVIEFPLCDKIKSLKMFKNGRVDIRFASALLSKQFADEYLGTVA